jgi:DNA-binding response OmpR family regulator
MTKKKILFADDEKSIRKLLEVRLKKNNYEVILADGGLEALEKIKSEKPDLVILDVGMPDKNGYLVCNEIKANPETKHIPVIIFSSWVKNKNKDEDGVADAYIAKPLDPELLIAKIEELLNPSKA